MSQQDNFVAGFLAGAFVGGVVGGVVGVVVSSRLNSAESDQEESFAKLDEKSAKPRKRQLKAPTEQSIEMARRGLEDKIAQLNDAIDDVRQQLSGVNGGKSLEGERAIARDS